jgi:uroporphyrinogen decarboxylase
MPDDGAVPGLYKEFGVSNMIDLHEKLGDDVYAVRPTYLFNGKRVMRVWDWYLDGVTDKPHRTLTAPGCFKDCETPEDIKFFKWPDPAKSIDYDCLDEIKRTAPKNKACMAAFYSVHFQDTCAAFGLETALMNMIEASDVVEAVNKHILDFYLAVNDVFLKTVGDKFQAVLVGNDMGTQRGLLLSRDLIKKFVIPGAKALIDQAHSYGKRVVYHSCGSIDAIIPDLIEAGADAINPIQAKAAGMEAHSLKARFGSEVSFVGGVDAQDLLPFGRPEEVAAKVEELRDLFPTGLVLSPSHESVMADVPMANIHAMFNACEQVLNK